MGKIRIKTFDESSVEDEKKAKAKKEAKKAEKMALKNAARLAEDESKRAKAQPTPVVETEEIVVTPEETITTPTDTIETVEQTVEIKKAEASEEKESKKKKKEKFAKANVKTASKRQKENSSMVSKSQAYTLDQALETLRKFKKSKFDETVELHINTKEKGISGQVVLPHGTGKTLRIKIADEAVIDEVSKGKINFDVLVATPQMMPQLAKVARVLGPRGLMPNPKNGTISDNPKEAVEKLSGGQVTYKTESAAPIIHIAVGKVSFEDKKLKENTTTLLTAIGKANISSAVIKSTMSPAIKLTV